MNYISRATYNELRKKAAIHKLKKHDQLLMDQYNEQRVPAMIAMACRKYGLDTILEACENEMGATSFKSDTLWHLAAHGQSSMVVTGLNLITEERLRDFVEREIHTSVNEQQLNVL